ncbi:MAG: GNAT family N-acetyltransferase [Chloroflexota bacterium]
MTGKVTIRDVIDSDLLIHYEQQLDPEATAMAAFPSRDREAFMAHWDKVRADPANINKTILYDGQVAGSLASFELMGEREVGYWIGREYWGRGIATKALRQFLGVVQTRPLFGHVAKHNVASRRVLEKCGFAVIGEDKYTNPAGEEVEEFVLKLEDGG